ASATARAVARACEVRNVAVRCTTPSFVRSDRIASRNPRCRWSFAALLRALAAGVVSVSTADRLRGTGSGRLAARAAPQRHARVVVAVGDRRPLDDGEDAALLPVDRLGPGRAPRPRLAGLGVGPRALPAGRGRPVGHGERALERGSERAFA